LTRNRSTPRPEAVRIFGRTYSIRYHRPSPLINNALGLSDTASQIIDIQDYQTPLEEADTVLHETLHGIAASMRLGLDRETEEKVVCAFATGLVGVFQDNPDFAKWLIEPKQ
jgi:hypothetical protein